MIDPSPLHNCPSWLFPTQSLWQNVPRAPALWLFILSSDLQCSSIPNNRPPFKLASGSSTWRYWQALQWISPPKLACLAGGVTVSPIPTLDLKHAITWGFLLQLGWLLTYHWASGILQAYLLLAVLCACALHRFGVEDYYTLSSKLLFCFLCFLAYPSPLSGFSNLFFSFSPLNMFSPLLPWFLALAESCEVNYSTWSLDLSTFWWTQLKKKFLKKHSFVGIMCLSSYSHVQITQPSKSLQPHADGTNAPGCSSRKWSYYTKWLCYPAHQHFPPLLSFKEAKAIMTMFKLMSLIREEPTAAHGAR